MDRDKATAIEIKIASKDFDRSKILLNIQLFVLLIFTVSSWCVFTAVGDCSSDTQSCLNSRFVCITVQYSASQQNNRTISITGEQTIAIQPLSAHLCTLIGTSITVSRLSLVLLRVPFHQAQICYCTTNATQRMTIFGLFPQRAPFDGLIQQQPPYRTFLLSSTLQSLSTPTVLSLIGDSIGVSRHQCSSTGDALSFPSVDRTFLGYD